VEAGASESPASGLLDTRTRIDLDVLDPATLPATREVTAVTCAFAGGDDDEFFHAEVRMEPS
jgi:hypothetical protein